MRLDVGRWHPGRLALFWVGLLAATAAAGLATFYGMAIALFHLTGRTLDRTLEIDLAVAGLVCVGAIAWGVGVTRRWYRARFDPDQ